MKKGNKKPKSVGICLIIVVFFVSLLTTVVLSSCAKEEPMEVGPKPETTTDETSTIETLDTGITPTETTPTEAPATETAELPSEEAIESELGAITFSRLTLEEHPKISTYISIVDPDGKPISIIGIEDRIVVTEEKGPVENLEIIPADPVTDPLCVVLAIDISGSMAGKPLEEAKLAAEEFVRLLNPEDRAGLVTFDQDVYINISLTDDKESIIAGIQGLQYKGDTALYQAVIDSAKVLGKAPEGRRIIVILTDGRNDKANSIATEHDAVTAAGLNRAVVITVGLGNQINEKILQYIAYETGGRFFHATKPEDLIDIYRLISEQIHAQYRLSFTSPFTERPDRVVAFHTIDVSFPYGGKEIKGSREFLFSTNPPISTGSLSMAMEEKKKGEILEGIVYAFIVMAFVLVVIILLILIFRAIKARRY